MCSWNMGRDQSRRSRTSTSNAPCVVALSTTQGATRSADRVGRVLPMMILSFNMRLPCERRCGVTALLRHRLLTSSSIHPILEEVKLLLQNWGPMSDSPVRGGFGDVVDGLLEITKRTHEVVVAVAARHDLT